MSLVNLLAPELHERQAVRRTTSLVVAVGLAALALIGILYFFQVLRLSQVRSDLEVQQSTNARLVSQIASLREFAALQAELAAKEALIDVIFVNEVSWSSALLDVSRVIPDASYLTNLTGQIFPALGERGLADRQENVRGLDTNGAHRVIEQPPEQSIALACGHAFEATDRDTAHEWIGIGQTARQCTQRRGAGIAKKLVERARPNDRRQLSV